MNDAYEFYDYGDFFPIVSFNSIHFTQESKNKIYKKYIERINEKKRIALEKHMKEMRSRADEVTRKGLADNLSRLQEYIDVKQNTDALLSYINFVEAKPIKLRGDMFGNTEAAGSLLMNNGGNSLTSSSDTEQIDVQIVADSEKINDSVDSAFNNSSDASTIDVVVGNNNTELGSFGLVNDGELPENSFGSDSMPASLADKIGIDDFIRNPSAFVDYDTDKGKQSDSSNASFSDISNDKSLESFGDFVTAQTTEDSKLEYQKTTSNSDNIRDDIKVVADREEKSMSDEHDNTTGKAVLVENSDSIFDTSDMVTFGDFYGYNTSDGKTDYYSLLADLTSQKDYATENVRRLFSVLEEKSREGAETTEHIHGLESEIESKLAELFKRTENIEKKGKEIEDQISSLDETIAQNNEKASKLAAMSSQLDEILADTDITSNDTDIIRGKGMH